MRRRASCSGPSLRRPGRSSTCWRSRTTHKRRLICHPEISHKGEGAAMGSDTLAIRFGIRAGDGLQTRSWVHHADSSLHSDPSFYCVLCGTKSEMAFAWTTLFNGQEALGDLCAACVG